MGVCPLYPIGPRRGIVLRDGLSQLVDLPCDLLRRRAAVLAVVFDAKVLVDAARVV